MICYVPSNRCSLIFEKQRVESKVRLWCKVDSIVTAVLSVLLMFFFKYFIGMMTYVYKQYSYIISDFYSRPLRQITHLDKNPYLKISLSNVSRDIFFFVYHQIDDKLLSTITVIYHRNYFKRLNFFLLIVMIITEH